MSTIVRPQQIIYFGAPGTGKSYLVDRQTVGRQVIRATIHPEYSYADFVGQLLPTTSENGEIRFEFMPGPLTEALEAAFADRSQEVCLVLEELSRGNVAAVFGDTFQLLDRGDDGNSRYRIFNRMIAARIPETEEALRGLSTHEVFFPANLSILATVNVNDQNVAPMDTAFKRRFDWQYVASTPVADETRAINTQLNNPAISVIAGGGLLETNWLSFYSALNEFIVDTRNGMGRNEDRQVGQFFLEFPRQSVLDSHDPNPDTRRTAAEVVNHAFKNKLLQYLWQDVAVHTLGFSGKSLFAASVTSFGELYRRFGTEQVFSDDFLDDFLLPGRHAYTY